MQPIPTCRQQLQGHSPALLQLRNRIGAIAKVNRTTLISGPTGSGKELVARDLHARSARSNRPLVTVHCGALPESLLDSELFGHAKGAYTGATTARAGLFASANGGTLFLDEVNSLSLNAQCKLLRFLESGEYRSVGSDRTQTSDSWVIAATNQELKQCVKEGTFRQDLLFRLDVLRIEVPSLENRCDDILFLARFFLNQLSPNASFTDCACVALMRYSWPGNVRELKHKVESAALFGGHQITEQDLGLSPEAHIAHEPDLQAQLWSLIDQRGYTLPEAMGFCERLLLQSALTAECDNRTRAASRLGIHMRTIFKKLAQVAK